MVIDFYTVLFKSTSFLGHWQIFQITVSVALKIDPAMLLIGEGELGMANDRKGAVPPETRALEAVSFCEY